MNAVKRLIAASAVLLARAGVLDEARGRRIADIAWPQFVIGVTRKSKRMADFIMVGTALGPAAVAGMGFAFAYWSVARGVGFSLANGGMTFMAQRFGADDPEGFDLAFKQTLWIELAFAGTLTAIFVAGAPTLIGVLGASPESLGYGVVYLRVVAVGFLFAAVNNLANKALVSADDAWMPMIVRGGGAVLNIVLNAVFIFGLGLGVFGAALGTLVSVLVIFLLFSVCLLRGRLPYLGTVPVTISLTRPYFDLALTRQILEVGSPLMGRRLVSRLARFPMLILVAKFGTIVVAAYVVSRQVRGLMNTPGWGFGDAGRSLVGQELGEGREEQARAYGWDTVQFAVSVYVGLSVATFVFARPIAALFTNDPAAIEATIPFVRVMAVSLLGMGIDGAASGILSGGGDTRWPLYGRLIGLYVFMIPLAYLGVVTPLGVAALYLAITAETVVPALVTFYRFTTDRWIAISQRYRQAPTD